MSRFLDTSSNSSCGIALCARCSKKFPVGDLREDPNVPGLMVCEADMDEFDPYRLAPRAEDQITLMFTRPDLPVNTDPGGLIQEAGDLFIITEDGEEYLEI
jgi:hypothetical protein